MNDRIGYEITTRATSLDYVKSKNDAHADVMEAYNNATIGLKTLTTNETLAKQKLTAAIDAFKVIMTESDVYDKKARIDNQDIHTYEKRIEVWFQHILRLKKVIYPELECMLQLDCGYMQWLLVRGYNT